jgi:hypothetical protein
VEIKMKREDAKVGMQVVFGRPGGEKTIGKILKLNPTKAKVETLEARGRKRKGPGKPWQVPYCLMEPYTGGDKNDVVISRGVWSEDGAIKVGETTFRYHYADSNPLWKVMKVQGRDSFLCEIQNEPVEIDGEFYESDWVGTQKLFMRREIEGAMRLASMFDDLADEHDKFYKSLRVGQTIHYHDGFNTWVRCVVVEKDGEKVLKPVALVGEWRKHDLPSRMHDGSIHYPHHVKQIIEGKTMQPNASNLWENGCKGNERAEGCCDPTKLVPLSLTVPPMTPEEERVAKVWQRVAMVRAALETDEKNPEVILAAIRKLVN